MTIKQTTVKLPKMFTFVIVAFGFAAVLNMSHAQTADAAWCDNSGSWSAVDDKPDCYYENMKEATETLPDGKKVDVATYQALTQGCIEKDQASSGACSNAVVSCLRYSMEPKKCETADYVSAVADDCNAGRLDGPSDRVTCDPIAKANYQTIDVLENNTLNNIQCTDANSSQEARKRCDKALTDARVQCGNKYGLGTDASGRIDLEEDAGGWNAGTINNGQYTRGLNAADYEKCLQESIRKSATDDKGMCESANGVYVGKDTKDPNGPNTLSKGCYYEASDLTNPEACAAAGKGFVWKKTSKAGQPEAWECEDPANPDGKDNDDDKEDDSPLGSPSARLEGAKYRCGQAKTNLLGCGTEQGATALQNVLRIFVIVLSFGVGIAALGGLAYSAVQYAGAADNQSSVSAARERIRNVVIGLFLYGFLLAIANWLVPGGIL